jgi:hypothetical protein
LKQLAVRRAATVERMKMLDARLANIHAGREDFILADAKDADMGRGLTAPGIDPHTGRMRSLADYRDQMREITRQGLVDIMLMSVSSSEILTVEERLFEDSPVTPAVRANDTSDVHKPVGGTYATAPSRPFRTATTEQVVRDAGVDLGLYSITPANDAEHDIRSLEAYKAFRLEAAQAGLRHFLEVFSPNVPGAVTEDHGRFLNDFIVRAVAGIPKAGRPLFLKIPYPGPEALEELASYDPHLVPGILGGSAGSTLDAFTLLEDARRHGARVALFGRKINASEHPLTFVRYLRLIADGEVGAQEAARAYEADLERLGLAPAA